jgi:protein SCO1/2
MNANTGAPRKAPARAQRSSAWGALLGLLFGSALLISGCSKTASSSSASAPGATAKADEKRFPLTGEIVRVEPARKVLVVKHDEIAGYMPAMTMEFLVGEGDLAVAKPGQKIRAEMVPSKDGDFRLEKIWPNDKAAADAVAAGEARLAEDTHNLGKDAYREIGDKVPSFVLFDQEGRVVDSARFAGKQVMLNFIFTRCPVATMCPASTAKMMSLQKLAREAGVKNLELVSITLDPAYDTPGVLKDYAQARGIDTSNFSFLTGPERAIKNLLTQFGVIAQFQGDILQHTLATLLIGEDGKIRHRADSSQWEPQEFVAKMRK